jgi:sulfur carrier protein ThiS
MQIKLFLSSTLRTCIEGYDAINGVAVELERPTTVSELCRKMNVPQDRVKMIMINGTHASMDCILQGGERVGLFPPVGGG